MTSTLSALPKSPAGYWKDGQFFCGSFPPKNEPTIDRPLTPPLAEDIPVQHYYCMPVEMADTISLQKQRFIEEAERMKAHHIRSIKKK